MIQIRLLIYLGIAVSLAGSAWFALNKWHYLPIKILQEKNKSIEIQIAEVGRQLNVCEANLSKQALQGYIDGVGNDDTYEEPVIDFNNITF